MTDKRIKNCDKERKDLIEFFAAAAVVVVVAAAVVVVIVVEDKEDSRFSLFQILKI